MWERSGFDRGGSFVSGMLVLADHDGSKNGSLSQGEILTAVTPILVKHRQTERQRQRDRETERQRERDIERKKEREREKKRGAR